ncbi:Alg9-like mannosyltransferase family-domain-containing protein [Lipomyces japonicus]|uniref:Alg9-like mannosyltransferase family-domain-containing protein n=1 Tax=Lipomyces japonicus TaxID=56871 RepID=UPI0034CF6EC2
MIDVLDYSYLVLILVHLFASPFTKVEESFNLHAIHDILMHGSDIYSYDHFEFPGVVPRTFIGAIVISLLAKPVQLLAPWTSKFALQYIVRGILGLINGFSLIYFRRVVTRAFGNSVGFWFGLFQYSQFHITYYASRTLPNMFAFPLTTIALALWIHAQSGNNNNNNNRHGQQQLQTTIAILAFATIVFRFEILIVTAAVALSLLINRQLSPSVIIVAGLKGGIFGLILSAIVDSYFWQFPLIPEIWGFYFNAILGKSSEWGVEPIHAYFSKHIPKLLLNPAALPLAVFGILFDRRSHKYVAPTVLFISVYSLQPHKEWRFIIYVVPLISLYAAFGASWLSTRIHKSFVYKITSFLILSLVGLTFLLSGVFLYVSSLNYPGGQALQFLNHQATTTNVSVHLDVSTCMTGATLFLQTRHGWEYDKTEHKHEQEASYDRFTHVISADADFAAHGHQATMRTIPTIDEHHGSDWHRQHAVKAFAGINPVWTHKPEFFLQPGWWNYVVKLQDRIFVYNRQ